MRKSRTSLSPIWCALSLIVVFATHAESAWALSDRMVMADSFGGQFFDDTIDGVSRTWMAHGSSFDPLAPTNTIVVLLEPPGVPTFGELPPIFLPGTDVAVSALVLAAWVDFEGHAPSPGVMFLADSDPRVAQIVPSLIPGASFVTVQQTTGGLQEIVDLLGIQSPGYVSVAVQSDIVPEPGTGVLLTLGLLGLAGWRRTRA